MMVALSLMMKTQQSFSISDATGVQEPGDMQGYKIIRKVEPVLPESASQSGVLDPVRVRLQVDEAGNVVKALILEGHPLLNQPALDAVKHWKYKPMLANGNPVPFLTPVRVDFQDTGRPKIDVAVARLLARMKAGKSANPVEGQFVSGGRARIGIHLSEDTTETRTKLMALDFVTDPRQWSPVSLQGNMPIEAIPQLLKLKFVQFIDAASPGIRGGNVREPKIIRQVEPSIARAAGKANIPAAVQLEITIDEEGNVAEAHILQGHPLRNRAAIEAVGQWKYTPLYMNQVPLPVVTKVSVAFTK